MVIFADILYTRTDETFYVLLSESKYINNYSAGTLKDAVLLLEFDGWRSCGKVSRHDGVMVDMFARGNDEYIAIWEEDSEIIAQLIPQKEPQKLTIEMWDECTPCENKLELIDGEALWGDEQRDRMVLALVYNMGLEEFARLLPAESRETLKGLL